ncbi:hypothetical protein [Halobaculum magnesiiphilum]|uniref:Uncharacterized protein n=1 Tax=Halobaculum magnesiiphilum TaxID=1017351 RepID=A0A8T8W9L9_9EURY|nr:hypothetical protein [Halobaculum magnesiiphilum]QZP36552.1 hypothetical protein K6T50_09505 [Halobaculum magnesiiphilum]
MRLRNREGDAVDAVPFLVVAGMAFMIALSFGPIYLMALFGVDLPLALTGSVAAFVATAVAAYHRLVRSARPDLRENLPASWRFRRLLYAAVAFGLLLVLLTLPLVDW